MTNKGQLYPWVAGLGPLNTVAVSTTHPLYIGDRVSTPDLSGMISNVQLYNVTLSQTEITALYDEGIGGAPIDLQNLVGWWPLNGNANDYSGNENNGQATNVIYTGSWGVATPRLDHSTPAGSQQRI